MLDPIDPVELAKQCASFPEETGWIEWKVGFFKPEDVGKYVSGLSNTARLLDHERAYLIWGIDDQTREIVGTPFNPRKKKKGNEDFIPWLSRSVAPANFEFIEGQIEGKRIVVLQIPAASGTPTKFAGQRYIRIGSYLKPLADYEEEERRLWAKLQEVEFEAQPALTGLGTDRVLGVLDCGALFRMLGKAPPSSSHDVLEALVDRRLARRNDDGRWTVTNLGAMLFANDLRDFDSLSSKAVRLVRYQGKHKGAPRSEIVLPQQGYAVLYESLLAILNGLLPVNEVIQQALRKEVRMFPEIVLRELIANAMVHQDFSVRGAGPMIELFDNRLVVRNPGHPLIKPDRFLDLDRARNPRMVDLMRLLHICEKSGTGIDKALAAIEAMQLPAPEIVAIHDEAVTETIVTVFATREFREMTVLEKTAAAYWHAAFKYVEGDRMSNESLRNRFNLDPASYPSVSVIIRNAQIEGRIKVVDASVGNKARRYVPFWVS